jgi:CheY-like chemotaxis protein
MNSISSSRKSANLECGRALVVDDEPVVRTFYAEVLQFMGFEVDTAEDGEKALSCLRNNPYGLVISDMVMPGMSGTELCQKAEEIRPGSGRRFVFTTGYMDYLQGEDFSLVSERPCIQKPATLEDIQRTVDEFISTPYGN